MTKALQSLPGYAAHIKGIKEPVRTAQMRRACRQPGAYLDHWEEHWADKRIHGRTKRQVAAMFAEEKPFLQALLLEPFRYYQYGERAVHLAICTNRRSHCLAASLFPGYSDHPRSEPSRWRPHLSLGQRRRSCSRLLDKPIVCLRAAG
jgi:hypothetical protein